MSRYRFTSRILYVEYARILIDISEAIVHIGLIIRAFDLLCQVVGFVDYMDICKFLMTQMPDTLEQVQQYKPPSNLWDLPVSGIMAFSGKNPLMPMHYHIPALDGAKLMAFGVHRLPLFDDSKKLTQILTQSDMVRYVTAFVKMHSEEPAVKHMMQKKLGELHIGKMIVSVFSCRNSTTIFLFLSFLVFIPFFFFFFPSLCLFFVSFFVVVRSETSSGPT